VKKGDLVRYKDRSFGVGVSTFLWDHGLLIEFDQVQRICIILDNKTGKLVKKSAADVQLERVGYAGR
jgi:hypothetical protein